MPNTGKDGGKRPAEKKRRSAEARRAQTAAAREKAREASCTFPTAEAFREAASAYFDECDRRGVLYGEGGLALWLGEHNEKQRPVTLTLLRRWYDGDSSPYLQDAVQMAYLRIQEQIETDARYREKGMVTRGIFLQKQTRLGGYQDKIEQKNDTTVRIVHGDTVDESDFQ